MSTWSREIYVATQYAGVYYTHNFISPAIQPIWEAVNIGLGSLTLREFHLDPFHKIDRQYVLTDPQGADDKLYMREYGGAWVAILTPADLCTMWSETPCIIWGFGLDPSVDGRIWANVQVHNYGYICCYSGDHGHTWVKKNGWYGGAGLYAVDSIRTCGSNVIVVDSVGAGARQYIEYSIDAGAHWDYIQTDSSGWHICQAQSPLEPNYIYVSYYGQLYRYILNGGGSILQASIHLDRGDAMWFHPTISNQQRLIYNGKLYATTNGWSTMNSPSAIDIAPYSISEYSGNDNDMMLVGITIDHNNSKNHVIGTLYGEEDLTATGIAGTNCGTSPFTDSIPYTCGGAILGGIAGCSLPPLGDVYVYGVAMPDYLGLHKGLAIPGDRIKVYTDAEPSSRYPGIIWVEENP